jgi:hypothetical protein
MKKECADLWFVHAGPTGRRGMGRACPRGASACGGLPLGYFHGLPPGDAVPDLKTRMDRKAGLWDGQKELWGSSYPTQAQKTRMDGAPRLWAG